MAQPTYRTPAQTAKSNWNAAIRDEDADFATLDASPFSEWLNGQLAELERRFQHLQTGHSVLKTLGR